MNEKQLEKYISLMTIAVLFNYLELYNANKIKELVDKIFIKRNGM